MTSKELHLSIVDQCTFRKYIKDLFVFPFPDISRADDALHALRTGLSLTLRHYPHMAGTLIVPDLSRGYLKATYPDPVSPDHGNMMLAASFDQAANPQFDYRIMEKEGFPPAMLPPNLLCPTGLQNHPGLGHPYAETGTGATMGYAIPVMRAQATFIPGGLVLSVYGHHGVLDGIAFDLFFKVWSGYVKDINAGVEVAAMDKIEPVDSSAHRRALDALLPASPSEDTPRDGGGLSIQPTKIPYPTIRSDPYETTAKIVCLPASAIATLKGELQALTTTRISTFITLTSLMWVHAIRARSAALQAAGCDTVALAIAVHLGKRAGPAFPKDFSGNLAPYATTPYPLSEILNNPPLGSQVTAQHLFPVALALTFTLAGLSPEWLARRIEYLSTFTNPSKTFEDTSFANGPVMMITTWQHLGADWVWNIPGTGGDGKASALRKPSYRSEGGMRVLARREGEDRDYEVLMCLEVGEMERFIEGLGERVGRVVEGWADE
ncbi:hypothetical protein CC86DRAFT_406308 [Ophiobolus disseminans]|uniref:Trichothecene 3-O-acetyltransferase-like N-terminal domain-containing protein n=1 Tax=Ophiobolus disseminans TaxID=1469910 RepID=A0A6A7A175_9PLEO|nr:hypothetical protein CC86DRAFT_406308 [Ophiobolus disseminans]